LVYSFVKKWYLENYDENRDGGFDYDLIWWYWMSKWPLCIQDQYYFSVDEVYECLLNKIPMNIMLKWWDYSYENQKREVNLINFWKLETMWKSKYDEIKEKEIKSENKFRDLLNNISK
jgi:hypothetical protein